VRALFYDTWGFVALANARDPSHDVAADADRACEEHGWVTVTSDYVIDETLTLVHTTAGASAAVLVLDALLTQMEGEPLMLVDVTRARRERAYELFRKLAPDTPRLSFTDCTSFVIMQELEIDVAFTADSHYHRPGGSIRPLFERTERGLRYRLPE
jgi:predicted nucleic acid-binding protein